MTFDPSKPVQTRDGSIKWDKDGLAFHAAAGHSIPSFDLINVPKPRAFYLCIGNEMILPADHADGNYRITICEGCEPKIEEVKP